MPGKENGLDSLNPNQRAMSVDLEYFIIAALWFFSSDLDDLLKALQTQIERKPIGSVVTDSRLQFANINPAAE